MYTHAHPLTALTWPNTGDGDEPVAVAGVKADLCRSWPALGTVSEGWAAHASQLSVSGFSFVLVVHLEGKVGLREKQVLPEVPAFHLQQMQTQTQYIYGAF